MVDRLLCLCFGCFSGSCLWILLRSLCHPIVAGVCCLLAIIVPSTLIFIFFKKKKYIKGCYNRINISITVGSYCEMIDGCRCLLIMWFVLVLKMYTLLGMIFQRIRKRDPPSRSRVELRSNYVALFIIFFFIWCYPQIISGLICLFTNNT